MSFAFGCETRSFGPEEENAGWTNDPFLYELWCDIATDEATIGRVRDFHLWGALSCFKASRSDHSQHLCSVQSEVFEPNFRRQRS